MDVYKSNITGTLGKRSLETCRKIDLTSRWRENDNTMTFMSMSSISARKRRFIEMVWPTECSPSLSGANNVANITIGVETLK